MKHNLTRFAFLLGITGLFVFLVPASQSSAQTRTIDEQFVTMAEAVPEFAGYYYMGNTLHINVTSDDPSVQERVLAYLIEQNYLERDPNPPYVIDVVQYSFTQLNDWYQEIYETVWAQKGITRSSINEGKDKIVIGAATESDKTSLEQALRPYNIPADAIEISIAGPFQFDNQNAEQKIPYLYMGLALFVAVVLIFVLRFLRPRKPA